MVKLENIRRDKDRIYCDAYPEDSKSPIRMEVSISTGAVSHSALPEGYEYWDINIRMAKFFLLENADKLPETQRIMWY